MSLTVLALLTLVGVAVGLLSGLVGIGGGVLIVPFLYFFYAHPEWAGIAIDPALQATVAHATSLFIIVPTSIRGTLVYQRDHRVAWDAALPIAAGAIVAAILGARLALLLPAEALKLGFGVLLVISGARMLPHGSGRVEPRPHGLRTRLPVTLSVGVAVGLFSALLGVGGGLIAIPLLIYVVGLELGRVAATSLAIIMFAATAGVTTYIASGWGDLALPQGLFGYVHVWSALPVLLGSLAAVRWGAWANQRMNVTMLRIVFAVLFVVMGLRLVLHNGAAVLG